MDPLAQAVARLEKAVDMHGARLAAVEKDHAEITATLNGRTEGHEGTGHRRAHTPTAGGTAVPDTFVMLL
jgi:hypothetical protein